MAKFQIGNTISGVDLGAYEATDEQGALDAMAQAAGYADYAAACDVAPVVEGEIVVTKIDESQEKYDKLYPAAYDRAMSDWLGGEELGRGIDGEQEGKSLRDALNNTWTDDIETSEQWAVRAVTRLNGPG